MKHIQSALIGLLLPLVIVLITSVYAFSQQNTHQVEKGETLYSIAQQYDVTVQQLREWNDFTGNSISPGQILIVSQPTSEDTVIHEVEPKETLFSISKKYGVSIAAIKNWNNLAGNELDIGQQLTIYPDSGNNTDLSGTGGQNSMIEDRTTATNTYYIVKSGDTLFEIARKHNMTVRELKDLNDLTTDTIRIGQQLTVKSTSTTPSVSKNVEKSSPQGKFVEYQLDSDKEIRALLSQFKMDRREFTSLNPDITNENVRKGQKVTILLPPSKSYKNPYRVNSNLKNLGETAVVQYDSSSAGTTTASGELHNPDQLTAAHSNIAMGTIVFIQNPDTKMGIYIRINDRISTPELKLSAAAYNALGFKKTDRNPTVKIFQDQ